jgi:RHS repeat-associated protein
VQRVRSGVTTVFVYDAMGALAAEYDSPAAQPSTCGTCYLTADTLGSTRMITDETATPRECHDYLPFGEEINRTSAGGCYAATTSNTLKFTGKERDGETGNDYFGARYFSGAQERWTTSDWSAEPEPVPYASLSNPQTLNLYEYLHNNPLGGVDPDGHSVWEPGRIGCGANQPGCHSSPVGDEYDAQDQTQQQAQNQPQVLGHQTLSSAGIRFMACQEEAACKPSLEAYDASRKRRLGDWTIGWGHKIVAGEDFSKGITETQADDLFREDLRQATEAVNGSLKYLTSSPGQFDAMVSLAFNIGPTGFANSTLIREFNAGGRILESYFTRWNQQKGQVMPGLTARRKREYILFNTGSYP